eukprot:9788-Eustigmatos_ZCMA.PRE.1
MKRRMPSLWCGVVMVDASAAHGPGHERGSAVGKRQRIVQMRCGDDLSPGLRLAREAEQRVLQAFVHRVVQGQALP